VKATTRRFLSGKTPVPEHAPSPAILSQSFAELGDRIHIRHIDIRRGALLRAVKQHQCDVILPALHSLGNHFPCPWLAYAYDFQHKYFPQNFTPEDCRSRDDHFAELLKQAKAVIVNSRGAAADIARFVPQGTARVFALPFAPAPSPDWFEDLPETLPRYGVKPPFFIISNQFWVHKDHATAFDAFRIVANENHEISLVCTGSTAGSRDTDHFPRLMSKLKTWGLDQRVRILGLIPKRDQIEVMKHACAVIQPTLFEGGPGGGSVYDAVALDVPAIVSDIPVNREVEGPAVEFFTAGDAAALAERMKACLRARHQKASPADLLAKGRQQRAICGAMLWSALDYVLQ
jgi:glycosyltransferase involved in cell wall biosynthesis